MELIKKQKVAVKIVKRVLLYAFMVILGLILAFPFFLMVSRGLMTTERFSDAVMHVFPDKIMLSNYIKAFGSGGYGLPLLNSLWLYVLISVVTPFTSLISAYAFVRCDWLGKKAVFALMMATSMLPGVTTQVPLYVMYNNMGMLNTYWPLFLPNFFFAGAMNVFLGRQFMVSHPKETYESATIDGAGTFRSFIYICLPLCKTLYIYFGISFFIAGWGDYYTPSIFLKNIDTSGVPFALALYRNLWSDKNIVHPEYVFSACTIISLVPLVLYAVFQKYLVEGIAMAGIKG